MSKSLEDRIIQKTIEMRKYMKAYFRHRSRPALQKSLSVEKELDRMLEDWHQRGTSQQTLFKPENKEDKVGNPYT